MADQNDTKKTEKPGQGAGRGPSYPIASLQAAVTRVRKLFDLEGRTLVHASVAVDHWGYSAKSSGGRQMIATLLQYGLIRDEGSGEQRSVAVSNLGLDILLHDEGSNERFAALRTAARSPKLFADILATYAAGLPSDTSLKRFLIMDRNVTKDAVDGVLKNFRDTISYAKLLESSEAKADEKPLGSNNPGLGGGVRPEVGDTIQWESGGVLKLEAPRRVRAIQEDWVFVEGSETGIPMSETTVMERAKALAPAPPVLPETSPIIRTSAAEREWLRGPLSKETNYRLIVTGELGSREIGKLIKLLEAQKLVLDDDE